MAHVGKKLRFRLVGDFRLLFRNTQLFCAFAFGDIGNRDNKPTTRNRVPNNLKYCPVGTGVLKGMLFLPTYRIQQFAE